MGLPGGLLLPKDAEMLLLIKRVFLHTLISNRV